MKLSAVLVAAYATSATAFAPTPVADHATSTSLNMDRRSAGIQIAAGAATLAGLPSLALADGARSGATQLRSLGIYGQRIAALESAVNSGDFGAVAAEKNAFILFNSGALPKKDQAAAVKQTNEIFAAIRAKDSGALKKAYSAYKTSNEIAVVKVEKNEGQGFTSDLHYFSRTPAGAIYQR